MMQCKVRMHAQACSLDFGNTAAADLGPSFGVREGGAYRHHAAAEAFKPCRSPFEDYASSSSSVLHAPTAG